jgi:hypothetical protein
MAELFHQMLRHLLVYKSNSFHKVDHILSEEWIFAQDWSVVKQFRSIGIYTTIEDKVLQSIDRSDKAETVLFDDDVKASCT